MKASSERKPLLTITLGLTKPGEDEKHPEVFQRDQFVIIEDDGTIRLKLKRLTTTEKESEYLPIRKSDIPLELHRYISEQAIKEYNAALPTKEEMEKYLANYKIYLRLMENGVPVTFFVNNLGTAKATDVSVTMEFPDQVRIFDFEEIIETPCFWQVLFEQICR